MSPSENILYRIFKYIQLNCLMLLYVTPISISFRVNNGEQFPERYSNSFLGVATDFCDHTQSSTLCTLCHPAAKWVIKLSV